MFVPLVTYPDPVRIGLDYLRPLLTARPEPAAASVVVAAALPASDPSRGQPGRDYPVVVLRSAGGTSPLLGFDRPRLDAQVWHRDEYSAAALSQLVRGLLHQMAGWGPVRRVGDFTGPVPVPDPVSGLPRFLLTVELTVRGTIT
jgi:hypothetical protein